MPHNFFENSANPLLETWIFADTTDFSIHITNNKLFVQTADAQNLYKFWGFDYYNDNGESGYISLRYEIIND